MKTITLAILTAVTFLGVMAHTMKTQAQKEETTFIWNDTEDSLPADSGLVQIEFSEGNIVYLAPLPEYGLKPEYVIELKKDSAYIQTEEKLYIVHVRDIQKTIELDNL